MNRDTWRGFLTEGKKLVEVRNEYKPGIHKARFDSPEAKKLYKALSSSLKSTELDKKQLHKIIKSAFKKAGIHLYPEPVLFGNQLEYMADDYSVGVMLNIHNAAGTEYYDIEMAENEDDDMDSNYQTIWFSENPYYNS